MTTVDTTPARTHARAPGSRARRRAALTVLGAAAALVLSGCVKIDMAFTLHSDNTADGTVVYAIQDSAAKALGQDPDDLLKEATEGDDPADSFGEGATSEPYQQDGYTGTKITLKNSDLADLGGDSDSTDDPTASATADPDDLKIVRDGDEFVVSGKLDLADLGSDEGADESGLSADQIASLFDVKIAITFPGEVVSADPAATVDGNTVTWTSNGSDVINLDARGKAESGSGGLAWWVWLLVGLAVLAVVGLVLLLVLRQRKPADQAADGTATAAGVLPPDGGAPSSDRTVAPPAGTGPPPPPAPPTGQEPGDAVPGPGDPR